MAEIIIQTTDGGEWWEFEVDVKEEKSVTHHTVSMNKSFFAKLSGATSIAPEEVIRKTFEFLLAHEAKETVLRRFDLSSVNRYFPDYEVEIVRLLHGSQEPMQR